MFVILTVKFKQNKIIFYNHIILCNVYNKTTLPCINVKMNYIKVVIIVVKLIILVIIFALIYVYNNNEAILLNESPRMVVCCYCLFCLLDSYLNSNKVERDILAWI